MDMELQEQLQPQHQQQQEEEEEDEEEEEEGLVGRQSRRQDNNKTIKLVDGDKATEVAEAKEAEPSEEPTYYDSGNGNATPAAAAATDVGGMSEANGHGEEATQKNSVYFDSNEGNGSAEGVGTNPKDKLDIQSIINHHHQKDLGDEIFPCLSPSPVKDSTCEETSVNLEHLDNNQTGVDTDVDLTEEVDQKFTEIDVEEVLQKQSTHDLYCPNCHSCITRRVILHRRKRKVRNIRHKLKHEKFERHSATNANPMDAASNQGHDTLNICPNDSPTLASDDDGQPDIFRCLSCYSFFIPIGNSFKIFRASKDSNGDREMQDVQNITPSNTNWFFSIFASGNRKAAIDQDKRAPDHSVPPNDDRNPVKIITPAEDAHIKSPQGGLESLNSMADSLLLEKPLMAIDQETNIPMGKETLVDPVGLDISNQTDSFCSKGLVNTATIERQETRKGALTSSANKQIHLNGASSDVRKKSDNAVVKNDTGKTAPDHSVAHNDDRNPVKIITPVEDAYIQQGESESLNSADSLLLEKLPMAIDQETSIPMGKGTLVDPAALDMANQSGSFFSVGLVNSASIKLQETQKGAPTSSAKEQIPLNGVSSDFGEKSDNAVVRNDTGDDLTVIIETPPSDLVSSQNIDIVVHAGTVPQTGIDAGNIGAEASEAHQWDILKSIVYGGLLESITSLGIVSSAAASGASTLDILVMGLANLIGGLILIAHNLRELKNYHFGETDNDTNKREDRYQQVLGRRENFSLHATVVVLSFLIFGLIPPLTYGFSFLKSDNRDLKIAAVAGSSLACIILLAAGKGHTQRPPRSYIRTVLYYVIIGIMTSGVCYVVGDLLKKLLEKLNLFESTLDVTIAFPETNLIKPWWASY